MGLSSQTTRQERQVASISQMKEFKTRCTNIDLWKERELGAMHVLLKKKKTRTKFKCSKCNIGL
jgi:hypothetical protein